MRIGFGVDIHQLVPNRKLIIGGVEIPYEKGLLGHSDADVLIHAIEDGILGALSLGDIGKIFPDTDPAYKDASSIEMMKVVFCKMDALGYRIGNIDTTIVAEEPKLSPYLSEMIQKIADTLHTDTKNISVKATTTEELGYEGRKEGITAYAVVLLEEKE